MKWISVDNSLASIKKYHLVNENAVELVLKYNPLQHSGRISKGGDQRVFFIEQTGFWGNKIIFENEYGVEIGKLFVDKAHNYEGSIEMSDRKYQYSLSNNEHNTMDIYDNNIAPAHFSCDLQLGQDSRVSSNIGEEYACLLLGLCWYLFPLVIEGARTMERFSVV
jgi:hypothetical protein